MTIDATVLDTPAGPLALLAGAEGLLASGFTRRPEQLHGRLPVALRRRDLRLVPDLGGLSKAHVAYVEGDVDALGEVEVVLSGTDGQQRLWRALREVPPGQTVTYAELARRAGNPRAVRAAGSACARNLVAPAVPCHRVVRSDGGVGGYYYGLDVKRWLLEHERAASTRPA